VTQYDARPLTVGEILDRAISTYVRRCLPLFVILAITFVPVALIQLAALPGFTHMNDLFAQMNRLPPQDVADRNRLFGEAFRSFNFGAVFAMFVLGPVVLFPLSRNAVIAFTDAALDGVPTSIGAAYRVSFARWLPQIVTGVGYFVIFCVVAVMICLVLFVVIAVLAFAIGVRNSTAIGVTVIVLLIPSVAAMLLGFALINVAFELASISVALEEPNPVRAIGTGWRRAFDRALLRRTIGVAAAYLAVETLGMGALFAAGALLQSLAHVMVLQTIVSAIGQIFISGVLLVFMIVYARDVRLRREGLDLLHAASAPSPLP
jgi:hypothetical protein